MISNFYSVPNFLQLNIFQIDKEPYTLYDTDSNYVMQQVIHIYYITNYSYFHINFTHILGAHTETISDSSNCIITIMHIQNIPTEFLL